MDVHSGAAERLRRLSAVFGKLIGDHNDGIAEPDFGVAKASIGHDQFKNLGGAERLLVEFQRLDAVLDGKVWRYGVMSRRNRFYIHTFTFDYRNQPSFARETHSLFSFVKPSGLQSSLPTP